jgi:hypothetical protein
VPLLNQLAGVPNVAPECDPSLEPVTERQWLDGNPNG